MGEVVDGWLWEYRENQGKKGKERKTKKNTQNARKKCYRQKKKIKRTLSSCHSSKMKMNKDEIYCETPPLDIKLFLFSLNNSIKPTHAPDICTPPLKHPRNRRHGQCDEPENRRSPGDAQVFVHFISQLVKTQDRGNKRGLTANGEEWERHCEDVAQ